MTNDELSLWATEKTRYVLRTALLLAAMACEHEAAEYRRLLLCI